MPACRSVRLLAPLLALSIAAIASGAAVAAKPAAPWDAARVDALAAMLPAQPVGVGPRIEDRAAWQRAGRLPGLRDIVQQAQRLLKVPMPELSNDAYLDFSRTGNRNLGQAVIGQRHKRAATLVLAECVEGKGRFLPAIEESILALCGDRSWLLPAHDRSLDNFNGRVFEIDLVSAATSWNLATANYWLGERLSEPVRQRIREELERRTFAPMESYVRTGKPKLWWATGTNNWNAVCLAGVTGAALANIESPQRRAWFVAAAEHYVRYFLQGFTPDGYCSEGLSYWNYGFGHFLLLSETVSQATGGGLDLCADPRVQQIAQFGARMEILPGIYPALADCSPRAKPDPEIQAYLDRRFHFGWSSAHRDAAARAGSARSLFELALMEMPAGQAAARAEPAASAASAPPLRDWFADAGILIGRPAEAGQAMGVVLKGGHNAEHHNHNDLGSFVVAWQGDTPLLDPGSEVYTARTFSSRRYDSNVLNSFGHPVPRVAGRLQRTGAAAAAVVLKTDFTPQRDLLILDLRSAYAVDELRKLQRTFVYSREGQGSLTVTDEVEFATPQAFETALITYAPERRVENNSIRIGSSDAAVAVEVDAGDAEFTVNQQEIDEDVHGSRLPVRLGIELTQPVAKAKIVLTIRPAP